MTTIRGEVVLEWLEKWNDMPTLRLARMIYNADDNHKLFTNIETVRSLIRYYRGAHGERNKKKLLNTKFIK